MEVGSAQRIGETNCTGCGKALDGASGVACDKKPSSGDVTVCIYCGHIMAFSSNLQLRNLTEDEMYAIAGDERIVAISKAIRTLKQQN